MPYFSYLSHSYSPKNKLESAIQKSLADEFNRLVIDNSGLQNFQENIIGRLETINTQHPKCKPLIFYWSKHHVSGKEGDITLNISGVINFHIYKSV